MILLFLYNFIFIYKYKVIFKYCDTKQCQLELEIFRLPDIKSNNNCAFLSFINMH